MPGCCTMPLSDSGSVPWNILPAHLCKSFPSFYLAVDVPASSYPWPKAGFLSGPCKSTYSWRDSETQGILFGKELEPEAGLSGVGRDEWGPPRVSDC